MRRLRAIDDIMKTGMEIKSKNAEIKAKLLTVSKLLVSMNEGSKTLYLETKKKYDDLYPWIESHKMNVLTLCQIIFLVGMIQIVLLCFYLIIGNKNVKNLAYIVWVTNILGLIALINGSSA